ncbi:hypothetical protein [Saccharospirillum mangrovi]|uniref:hypothetical protein n=1 Tax=Saccharospirillum mangrovi TaxID=2161747 RepID=UPI00130079E3|nr:hypothetical protein [Saccharospirillum mangrovi]
MSIKQLWLALSLLGMVTLMSRPQAVTSLTESLVDAGFWMLSTAYETLTKLSVQH